MQDINEKTITQVVKNSFDTEPGSRFEKLLHGLLDHLHDYAREMNLTHEEWIGILDFLYDCGKISTPERHEYILLSDVLGFSAIVDIINSREGATEGSNLGPFYLKDAPAMELGSNIGEGREGTVIFAHGKVIDTLNNPIAGAVVDTWQADGLGTYPIQEQEKGQNKFDLRGVFSTDENGRYYYVTVMPEPYTVPGDGPVGKLLNAGNRHAWRSPHFHYIVRAPGMQTITTEVFFNNADYLDADAVFGVRKALIAKVTAVGDVNVPEFQTNERPDAVVEFDFVLAPED